jgi:peptidoglycan hydrolase-like protein with peptidoglycan-binding domain
VAKAPVNWNTVPLLTPGMKNLGNQFNLRWPVRDGTSDGAVGDYKHPQGKSGDNPDDTKYNNKHNYVRKMYTPPCPEITVDGDYGAATAAAFVDFWKKNGGTGTYDGRKLESWVALKYDAAYSQFVAPKSPTADPAALTAAVNKWLEEKFKNGSLNIDGSLKGVVTL